ncbi:MAG: hypothetical protein COY66_02175 [Candidatus Kerfeldbacteria bacterium CG_4_10_14_0_8_um_filter_42_10]|uniref:Uncharacterized protein n=1 Tax=Candidatus Kerfeldbacteria bacterium CG_4_10_14_0_8_um_filter_42_10 TaxID=2014248 RepID=A0A2M7RKQ0_9BACT|nr:MAG: hypothetical protein COY66_02175 [Candidatus Kerfeldbacteria bacterium CG_4_10_14_0_8_um_filter_42_10]
MKKILLLAGISTFFVIFLPLSVNALSFWDPSGTLGLGSADLQTTVIKIIQWILGLLGLVAVIMILYGGFTWLTSAGNEEKISKAKGVITAAVIGLVIVILSWAVVRYALNTLTNVSGAS